MLTSPYLTLLPLLASFGVSLPWEANKACPISLDGRIPLNMSLDDFNAYGATPYHPSFMFGENLEWSQILQFPNVTEARDDGNASKPLEVTINDGSIFAMSPETRQTGLRRAELLPLGGDKLVTGKKTLHFSIMFDPQKPLNYSHEYQLVFLESQDSAVDQIVLKAGTLIGSTGNDPKKMWLQGNQGSPDFPTFFSQDIEEGKWYNFGVVMDFDENTVQVLFSFGHDPYTSKTTVIPNDLSGKGSWHIGVLKKPTGNVEDITKDGYQEDDIDEGVIFGGVFFDDYASNCTSS